MPSTFKDSKYFFNRELSWVKFNERVLEEAADASHPLLERLKFIAIFSSNMDEFFMIRVAGLKEQIHAGVTDIAADGLRPEEVLERISQHTHVSVAWQAELLTEEILPKLRKKGIRLRSISNLRKSQKHFLKKYFDQKVFPVLTPLAIDPAHPFPQLKGLGLNLLVELRTPYRNDNKRAVIHIPSSLPRFIELPSENGKHDYILMEELIEVHANQLFPNMKMLSTSVFRITRNADLDLSEAEADDLLKFIEHELRKRRRGTVIRLEVSNQTSPENRDFLKNLTGLTELDVYDIPTYLDLSAFMSFLKLDYPDLKDPTFTPALNHRFIRDRNVFKTISQGDILLHHPYESFNHVVDFIHEAAEDPQVLAIKQTLYRTSGDSPIVKALKVAVENGKQVTALIELKARFDEQNNIEWAKELDRSGVNVVYGVLGLKTHCKICMVVRQEGGHIKRYLHLSTGNYNATTARIYTDLSIMTCNEEMGEDASGLFNLLTGYSMQKVWKKFFIAPGTLRDNISRLINACIEHHSETEPSRIILVMNSLVDPDMIRLLYKASSAGIKVDLVVRGICCLRPGVKGVSENIRVKSIVGRFLQHSRIFYFKYQGESQIYLGSADLMQRNLNRRVELVFPVEDPQIKRRVRGIIQHLLDDNVKSRYLQEDGSYKRAEIPKNEVPFNVQEYLLAQAQEKQREVDTISN
ncbi:MAG: polyphosphate kinase 1 [Bacteroidetes bacterium]|nr:MAG: polyphosphate kinase 1 [Bacteroidota bacterium]